MRTKDDNKKLCERFTWLEHDKDYGFVNILDELPPGWEDVALDMITEIDDELGRCRCKDKFIVLEAKEKYWMMRVYWGSKDPFDNPVPADCMVEKIISKYEDITRHICPSCGRYKTPGKMTCGRC